MQAHDKKNKNENINFGNEKQVRNFYEMVPEQDPNENNPNFKVHGLKIPFRMLIVGASGSMKTNCALDIVSKFSGTFYQITLCCRNADEPLYKLLQEKIGGDQLNIIEINGDDTKKLPKIEEDHKDLQKLVIFDDLVLMKNQKLINEFFIRSRKFNYSCMYLTQSYFGTPRVIRSNCDYIILKKIQSNYDLKAILKEYNLETDIEGMCQMYESCIAQNKTDWLLLKLGNNENERFFKNYEPLQSVTTSSSSARVSNNNENSEKTQQPETKKTKFNSPMSLHSLSQSQQSSPTNKDPCSSFQAFLQKWKQQRQR